jgi:Mn2+/Fe2+ NRAMP family transporter
LFKKIIALLLSFGPGIFAIGYTIGTGSVTSMIVAGSKFGMQLLWVLLLSCVFSGVLMFAYGNYALITSETALYGFRKTSEIRKISSPINYRRNNVWSMEFFDGNFGDILQYYL